MSKEKMAYQAAALAAEQRYGLPPGLLRGVLEQESNWNPAAKSPTGPIGIAQLSRAAARDLGVDPTDPVASIDGAARLLKQHFSRFNDWSKATRAYHDGAAGLVQIASGAKVPDKESQEYVGKVFSAGARHGLQPIPDVATAAGSPRMDVPVFTAMAPAAIKAMPKAAMPELPAGAPARTAPSGLGGLSRLFGDAGAVPPPAVPRPDGLRDLLAAATNHQGALFTDNPAFPDRYDTMIDQLIKSV